MAMETADGAGPRPRVQRHLRHPQAGEQHRRLQFGTGYPHRGPAPACRQRQRTYHPPEPGGAGDERKVGRLRVLQAGRDRTVAERPQPPAHTAMPTVAVAV